LIAMAGSAAAAAGTTAAGAMTAATASGWSAASIGSTILSAGGSLASGIAQQRAADYNAKVADRQARQSLEQGALAATESQRQSNQRVSAARTTAQEEGFDVSGSVASLIGQAERQGALEYLTAIYEGRTRAAGFRSTAAAQRAAGDGALMGGVIGAGTGILDGFTNAKRRAGAIQLTV
jgi:hypothetical protein